MLLSIQSSTVIIPYILQQSTLLLSEKYTSFGLQEVRTVYAGGYLGSVALRHHFSQIHTTHCCASWLLYCEERACGRVYRAQRNPTVIFYISNPTATASRRFYRPPVMEENITTLSNFKLVRSFPQKPYPPISFSHILQWCRRPAVSSRYTFEKIVFVKCRLSIKRRYVLCRFLCDFRSGSKVLLHFTKRKSQIIVLSNLNKI